MDDERFRLIVETTVDYAIFNVGLDGTIETWNPGAERIFGFTGEEIIGRHGSILFVPEDVFRGEPEREARFAAETGRAQDTRWHVRKDGSRFWANGVMLGLRDKNNTLRGLAKIVRDDSGLKQSEELLQYQLNLADAIANNAAEALFLIDSEGRTTFANPSARQMFGWTHEELVGQSLHEKLHCRRPDGSPNTGDECPHMQVLVTGETLRGQDNFFIHKDGRVLPVTCSIAPIRGESSVDGAVLVVRDVSEQRQAEEAIREKDEAFRQAQKLESIGVLAGGIAHDFNNLLHVVLGNADIALSSLATKSPAREPIEEVVRATLRAADLTRQLLAYSGKGAFIVRNLDLSTEVREMATLLRTGISKQATLAWELSPTLPAVSADPTQIRQIVMNLITNASDALGDTGGTITLRTGVTRLEDLEDQHFGVRLEGEGPMDAGDPLVYLEIGDTGSGMTPDTLSRIFDPFFSTKFTGRGLGLAAVMGIVRSHHGLIRVRTAPGEGTAFRVLFPAVSGAARKIGKPTADRSDWQGSGTILVVEDEQGVREVAERILQEIGFQTIGAEDGRRALEIMEEIGDSVTAVLLDLSMPRMGGAETFRRLRAIRPELPILMMSGYTEQVVAPQFSGSGPGVTGFLQKPFLAEDLIAVLRRFAESATE